MPAPRNARLMLFGVPRVRLDGAPLHLGTRKATLLLALLALDGPSARASLAEGLWPDLDAAAARRNLRREVFRLRGLRLAIVEAGDGTLALSDTIEVDLTAFQSACARGDDEQALGMAAAQVLAGLDGVASPEVDRRIMYWRERLLRERALARERLARRREHEGDAGGALALHLQALAEDPCAEAPARHAMRLQVAMGQRHAAITVYRRLHSSLAEELAVEPEAATAKLVAELGLAAAPVVSEPPAPPPVARPPQTRLPQPPFVGRRRERERILAAWSAGRTVYLSGAPGCGKSRLIGECAAERGPWLCVACDSGESGSPYAFAKRALRVLRDAAPDVALPPWLQRELAPLLDEQGALPPHLATAEAAERFQLAYAAAWPLLVQDNFQVVVFDDWQWCDAASSAVCAGLLMGPCARATVFRSAQLSHGDLRRMHAEVDGGRAVRVALEGLDEADTSTLMRALGATTGTTGITAQLHQATQGNPFFILETLRHLAQQPADQRAWHELPPVVHEVVLGRVRALGEPARRLLEAASLVGMAFDEHIVEGVTAASAEQAVDVLEHAQAAELVQAQSQGFRFAHELVRSSLQASLSAARRRLLHGRLAERLETRGAEAEVIAAHREAAGQNALALPWRHQAAKAAWRAHALVETRLHCEAALADGAAGAEAAAIHLLLAGLWRHQGDARAEAAAYDAAMRAAQSADAHTLLQTRLEQLDAWVRADRTTEVAQVLQALQPQFEATSAVLRARAIRLRAMLLRGDGDYAAARAQEDRAIALLEDQPEALAERAALLHSAALTAYGQGEVGRALAMSSRATVCFETLGDPVELARALLTLAVAAHQTSEHRAAAASALERARALAERCGHVPIHRGAILNLVKLHTDAGRSAEAIALLDEGEALAPNFEHAYAEQAFREARFYVHYLRGDVAAARTAAAALLQTARRLDDQSSRQGARQLVADLYLHLRDLDAAQAVLHDADAASNAQQLLHATLEAKRAWLELLRGEAPAALARIDALDQPERDEDILLVAWVGAAAELALGQAARAAARLAAVDLSGEHANDVLAMLLVTRLRVAQSLEVDDAAARERALALLAAGQVPALEAAQLRAALDQSPAPAGLRGDSRH